MIILYLLLAYSFTTFFGYISHLLIHQKWAGRLYKSHMNHHLIQYPSSDFHSDTYRSAGKDNSIFLFILMFSPVFVALGGLTYFHFISIFQLALILTVMISTGLLHDRLHDAFHLKTGFFRQFSWFEKLEYLHYIHHVNMKANFGIYSFFWDKIFKTFKK